MPYPLQEVEYGSYPWLRREVGGALDGKYNDADWDHDKVQKVDSIIQSGYMQMLYPPPLGAPREGAPAPAPHRWSFLTPVSTLELTVGESQYQLPDNFSGVVGEFSVQGESETSRLVQQIPETHFRQLASSAAMSGTPQYAAVRPVASDGTGRQTWEVAFYPTPDVALTLEYAYSVVPDTLSEARSYPLGGRQYAELLLQSCLAVLEQREKGGEGTATGRFLERLAAAVNLDVQCQAGAGESWPITASPSDAGLDRDYLERLVGRHMGFGPNPQTWTHRQASEVQEAIRGGLRRFYTPPVLPGERWAHTWSFLRPVASITTADGATEYDLPEDFAMFDGPLTFGTDTAMWRGEDVSIVSDHQVRRILSQQQVGRPTVGAVRVKAAEGPVRWQLVLAPEPDGEYELQFRYQTNPGLLANSASIPVGGAPHAQTIIESCLWAADVMLGGKQSVHQVQYIECLRSSVSVDRKMAAPQTLGRNLDRSDGDFTQNYSRDLHIVTYNGVEIS